MTDLILHSLRRLAVHAARAQAARDQGSRVAQRDDADDAAQGRPARADRRLSRHAGAADRRRRLHRLAADRRGTRGALPAADAVSGRQRRARARRRQMGRRVLSRRPALARSPRPAVRGRPSSCAIARRLFPDIDFAGCDAEHARAQLRAHAGVRRRAAGGRARLPRRATRRASGTSMPGRCRGSRAAFPATRRSMPGSRAWRRGSSVSRHWARARRIDCTAEEAIAVARAASPAQQGICDADDAQGLRAGMQVEVMPDDTRRGAVRGTVVTATRNEIAVLRSRSALRRRRRALPAAGVSRHAAVAATAVPTAGRASDDLRVAQRGDLRRRVTEPREDRVRVFAEQRWPLLDATWRRSQCDRQVGDAYRSSEARVVGDFAEELHRRDLRLVERLLQRIDRARPAGLPRRAPPAPRPSCVPRTTRACARGSRSRGRRATDRPGSADQRASGPRRPSVAPSAGTGRCRRSASARGRRASRRRPTVPRSARDCRSACGSSRARPVRRGASRTRRAPCRAGWSSLPGLRPSASMHQRRERAERRQHRRRVVDVRRSGLGRLHPAGPSCTSRRTWPGRRRRNRRARPAGRGRRTTSA